MNGYDSVLLGAISTWRGERPVDHCYEACELRTGKRISGCFYITTHWLTQPREPGRGVNEARLPETCRTPCAFARKKTKNNRNRATQNTAPTLQSHGVPGPTRGGVRQNKSHALAQPRPLC